MKPTYLSILMICTITVHAQNPLFQEPDFSIIKPYVPPKEEVKSFPDVSKSNSTKTEKVNGSTSTTHNSTSLGLVCTLVDNCPKCSGTGTQKTGGRRLALVTKECSECKGISNDMLYLKPCVECKNTRKVRELDVVDGEPIKTTTCSSCEGKGEITLYQFEVADVDFPRMNGSNSDGMNWFQARAACEALGNGWRLPTPMEFQAMYVTLHVRGKGNFKSQYSYWSEEYDALHAYNYSFEFGQIYNGGPKDSDRRYVRAVRTIK
jgi:hypothetical protein